MENKYEILIIKIIPVVLYLIAGAVSLVMAFKILTARRFLPFHENAAGVSWDDIQKPLQLVILALLKLNGAGFLLCAVLLGVFPAVNFFAPSGFYRFAAPAAALIFCSWLFIVNYGLYRKTKSQTPWKGSLYAAIMIIAGIVISVFW
ncbi:MAG: hypothetical protein ABSG94_11965 [Brevinematales bacterium]